MTPDTRWFFREYTARLDWEKYESAYRHDADFTPIATRIIRQIIDSVPGWTSQTEYFRVDVIGYESRVGEIEDKAQKAGLGAYLWNLKIAVEHENSKSGWTDELVKLAQLRCPLKVVIGYSHCDEREAAEQKKLCAAAEILAMTDAYGSIRRDGEEILVILGNGEPKNRANPDYTSFDCRGYLFEYASRAFVRI